MSQTDNNENLKYPCLHVHVVEEGENSRNGEMRCEIGRNLKFNPFSLSTYFFAEWDPVMYDLLLIAASVEFCDRVMHRPKHGWTRLFHVRIPVHVPERWKEKKLYESLRDSIEFVTGDLWHFEFISRKHAVDRPAQCQLILDREVSAVIPFSNGLDSCAVAELKELELGSRLVRIRFKPNSNNQRKKTVYDKPFTAIPFSVQQGDNRFVETSARSRGFKFALISGLAAYLTETDKVIVTESGQGALGPVLVAVGQIWEDYRNYPLFTDRIERFLKALLDRNIRYNFPQIWQTKGETLKSYVTSCKDLPLTWNTTISCWQQNRQVSVNGKARQCGICAACMLRRLSIHAAGLVEPQNSYVWENLSAVSFEAGASVDFKKNKITNAMREYAIAGTLHLEQIAGLTVPSGNRQMLTIRASELSKSLNMSLEETENKLNRLLLHHKYEWENFVDSLGKASFVSKWAKQVA